MSRIKHSQAAITAILALLIGGCSTQATGTLAMPTWDYLNNPAPATFDLATFQPEADTLYAIPMQQEVRVGEPVRIVVVTGDPANPFAFMAGVGVGASRTSGIEYVRDSFNVGAPGGDTWATDGLWSVMPGIEILAFPDNFIVSYDAPGTKIYAFNVTPLGGPELETAMGALFNFEVTFDQPGTYDLRFVEFNRFEQTFYNSHNLATNHKWGNISNGQEGVPNTITVTD